jgi:hypothetical protein
MDRMTARSRLPRSPEEQKAMKAARQARWRAKSKVRKAVDVSVGLVPGTTKPLPPMAKGDLAALVRERMLKVITEMPDEMLLNKDYAPMLQVALKAEAQIEARATRKANQGFQADVAFAIISMLSGQAPARVEMLDDGLTIVGEATEIGEG